MALFTFGGRGPMECCPSAAGTLAKIALAGAEPWHEGLADSRDAGVVRPAISVRNGLTTLLVSQLAVCRAGVRPYEDPGTVHRAFRVLFRGNRSVDRLRARSG